MQQEVRRAKYIRGATEVSEGDEPKKSGGKCISEAALDK